MPTNNPFAALARHTATLSELWARSPNDVVRAVELASNDLELLKAVVEIAQEAPELLAQVLANEGSRQNSGNRTKTRRKRSQTRITNVGTTDAIMEFVGRHPKASLRDIVDGTGRDKDKVSATSAMLVKRGRLEKTVEDGLNRYSIPQ